MTHNPLVVMTQATHQSVLQRLDEATRPRRAPGHLREDRARVNAFMAATSRHLAAVDEVLLPEVTRRMPEGRERVKRYVREARLLEQTLVRLKARAYGELHVAHLPWEEVWDDVRRRLASHDEEELELVRELAETLELGGSERLADRLYRAELRAPTRAHPYTPHTGLLGLTARRMWAVADRFWDTAEGRVIPPPLRPRRKDHSHDSLLSQYLIGEPRLDAEAPMMTHRRRARRSARARPHRGR